MERTPEAIPLAAGVKERLGVLEALLRRWTKTVNLVASADLPHIWSRHIEDSLQLADDFPPNPTHAIDLGSGAGFPGLVLAIATETPYHLIESDQRKAAFLREAIRLTGAPAVVHAVRAEQAAVPPAPLITARALTSLPRLLEWAAPLLAPGGVCLFPKGRTAEHEVASAAASWHMSIQRRPSRTDSSATILRISDLVRVRPGGSA